MLSGMPEGWGEGAMWTRRAGWAQHAHRGLSGRLRSSLWGLRCKACRSNASSTNVLPEAHRALFLVQLYVCRKAVKTAQSQTCFLIVRLPQK